MTFFHHIEDDLRHVTSRFRHHGDTISPGETQAPSPPGDTVSLKAILDDGKTLLEDGESKIRTFLDQHVPQLAGLADLIETNPIFASVEGALHVPPEILNGFAKALDALAAAYPKPAPAQPAAPVEAAAEPAPAA